MTVGQCRENRRRKGQRLKVEVSDAAPQPQVNLGPILERETLQCNVNRNISAEPP
jgi:hypothetical protein